MSAEKNHGHGEPRNLLPDAEYVVKLTLETGILRRGQVKAMPSALSEFGLSTKIVELRRTLLGSTFEVEVSGRGNTVESLLNTTLFKGSTLSSGSK